LGKGKILDFVLHLQEDRKLEGSTINQAVCALRTLYRDHLDLKWDIWGKIQYRRNESLPDVLTREEVALLLGTFRDGRYRAFLTVVYQCGLRLSEALHIKPKDIDGNRLVIRVVKGKGNKDRDVPITPELHQRLRRFWAWHRNPEWLFPGPGSGWNCSATPLREALGRSRNHMTKASIWNAINVVTAECGLSKIHHEISTHTLRHSYATHMLEAGTSVRQLSAYLGHSSLKPTMVYLHLTALSEETARAALATLASS
jgi:integrase